MTATALARPVRGRESLVMRQRDEARMEARALRHEARKYLVLLPAARQLLAMCVAYGAFDAANRAAWLVGTLEGIARRTR